MYKKHNILKKKKKNKTSYSNFFKGKGRPFLIEALLRSSFKEVLLNLFAALFWHFKMQIT